MSAPSPGSSTGSTTTAIAHFVLAHAGQLFARSQFEPAHGDPVNASLYTGAGEPEEATHELFSVVTEVNIVHLAIVILTLFITFFGLFSGFVKERLYVGEAIIATCFGIAFSGYAAGIFAPRTWALGHHTDEITLELTRIIIALSVFAVGVELPKAYVWRHWKSLAMLLGPIMFAGWMVAGALMYAIIPGLEFLPALVLAAGVTPTDPILASSVVGKGKYAQEHVPSHIRHVLQAESGCNDGAAFPFLYLALFLLLRGEHSIGQAVGYWVLLVLLYQIILGVIIGSVIGVIARKILKFSKRRELIDRESMVAMYVALSLLTTGLTTLAGSDDLLAAFCCGTAFAWDDWFTESIEESNFSSTIDLLANCAIFIYIGATMPFDAWNNELTTLTWWRLLLLCVGILALRRLPSIYALQHWIPDIKTRREAVFAGHFGPMGVGAIFISTLAASKLPTPHIPPENSVERLSLMIVPVTYCIVLCSILVHGLTISFFTLGRRVHSRVASFSRTLTAQSFFSGFGRTFSFGNNGGRNAREAEEPSWMSRVKRATRAEDIVINRDDDDEVSQEKRDGSQSPESLAEKGEAGAVDEEEKRGMEEGEELERHAEEEVKAEGKEPTPSEVEREVEEEVEQDDGDLAMFGAPTKDKVGAGQKERIVKERHAKKVADSRSQSRARTPEDGPGDRDEDVCERGGTDVEKEVECADDVRRGRKRAEKHKREVREDEERERDEHPAHNILGDDGEDESDSASAKRRYSDKHDGAKGKERERGGREGLRDRSPSPVPKRSSRLEARYCMGARTWQEGRKLIVDHGNGEVDVIDIDASPEEARKASKRAEKEVVKIPDEAVEQEKRRLTKQHGPGEHDKNAVKRAAAKMMRQGSAILTRKDEGLTPEEKERRRREKLERDAWCRKERKYRDSSPQRGEEEEWVEGDKMVTERGDEVFVRDLTPEEKRRKAKKHLAALRSLVHSTEGLEAEIAKIARTLSHEREQQESLQKGEKGKKAAAPPSIERIDESPEPSRSSTPEPSTSQPRRHSPPPRSHSPEPMAQLSSGAGPSSDKGDLSLFRTDRIEPESDEEEAAPLPAAASSSPVPRPMPGRQHSSAMQAMREIIFRGRGRDASASPPPGGSSREDPINRDQAASPSIRFAAVNRPERDGNGGGRPLPVVGSSLSVRREPSKRAGE
ncbi:hypothetical protein NBRC10512_001633 [Rhodotorula toruloides]|uniref:RHTO0S12e05204g1_1 n=1 Tax=Rhodotorula toruloides TaxID=5286 RepID=A0A061BF17_RHOTO|nr:RHTO0S12e05204g1_1 [Rhodotorula toruloides]